MRQKATREERGLSSEPVFHRGLPGSVTTAAEATRAVANVRACARAVAAGLVATGAATFFTGAGQVHDDRAAVNGHAVQGADGGLGDFGGGHFHKAEALGSAGFAVHHDLGGGDPAEFGKVAFQGGIGHGVGQVAHVDFAAHG